MHVFVTSASTSGTIPVAENSNRCGEQQVGDRDGQDEVSQRLVPGVAGDNDVRVHAAVVAGERRPSALVPILPRELRAVDRRRVAAAFRVDQEVRVRDVPLEGHRRVPVPERQP